MNTNVEQLKKEYLEALNKSELANNTLCQTATGMKSGKVYLWKSEGEKFEVDHLEYDFDKDDVFVWISSDNLLQVGFFFSEYDKEDFEEVLIL
jgi:hypothetical protein